MSKKVGPYQLKSKIGSGAFGTVYLGKHIPSQNKIAVKMINRQNLTPEHLLRLDLEIICQRSVDCVNVVKLLDFQKTEHNFYLILEYCGGGDLGNFLKTQGLVEETVAQRWMQQLVTAFKALRAQNIIHRDLKLQNILMTEPNTNAVLKLADFGMSRFVDPDELVKSWLGSPLYMAPEIFRVADGYDSKADIWSLGVVFYEIIAGEPPFTARRREEIPQAQLNLKPLPCHLSSRCQNLLARMLEVNPSKRISFEDMFEHPFIVGTTSDDLSVKASKGSSYATISSDFPNSIIQEESLPETQALILETEPELQLEHSSSTEDFVLLDNEEVAGEFVFLTKNDHPAINLVEISNSIQELMAGADLIIRFADKVHMSEELLGTFALNVKSCSLIAETFSTCESLIKKHQLTVSSHPAFFELFMKVKVKFLDIEHDTENLASQVELLVSTSDLNRITWIDSVGTQGVADSLIYNYVISLCKEASQDEFLREYSKSCEKYQEAMTLLNILFREKPKECCYDWEIVDNFKKETERRMDIVRVKISMEEIYV